ncbi:MAG: hypothetical protein AAF266_08480 [Planctomycetota bacterium]
MKALRNLALTAAFAAVSAAPAPAVLVFDNGLATNVVDSTVNDFIEVANSPGPGGGSPTTVTFNTGANVTGTDFFDDTVYVLDGSNLIFNDGQFANDVSGYDQSSITIFGGQFNDDLYVQNSARLTVSGGTIADDVEAVDNSEVFLRGGSFGEDIEVDSAKLTISGGQLATGGNGRLRVDGGGEIVIEGQSFLLDGSPIDFGPIGSITGLLSGVLLDGSVFTDIPFDRNPGGGFSTGRISLVAIPEASVVLPAMAITVTLTARNRRRR